MNEFTQSDFQKALDCFIVTGDDDELYLGQWCERFQGEVRKALTRCAHEAPAGDAWQPIESAPKDEPIMLFERGHIYTARLDTEYNLWRIGPGLVGRLPTHWQHLPKPPTPQKSGGEG